MVTSLVDPIFTIFVTKQKVLMFLLTAREYQRGIWAADSRIHASLFQQKWIYHLLSGLTEIPRRPEPSLAATRPGTTPPWEIPNHARRLSDARRPLFCCLEQGAWRRCVGKSWKINLHCGTLAPRGLPPHLVHPTFRVSCGRYLQRSLGMDC